MNDNEVKPQVVSEGDIRMVGPGHDDGHYITVPIKELYAIAEVNRDGRVKAELASVCSGRLLTPISSRKRSIAGR